MLRITLALAAAAVTSVAVADVYRTVDASGQVHYSDVWSPGATLIKSDHNHLELGSNSDSASSQKPASSDDSEQQSRQAAQKSVQSDMAAVKAQQCKDLKDQYDKVLRARRIRTADSSGPNPTYLSESQADEERVRTKQEMDAACAAAAANGS